MILYQLLNGKVIRLTIEQYIDLSDEDIAYLISIDYGEVASNPWMGSVISGRESSVIKIDSTDEDLVVPPDLFLEDDVDLDIE